MPISRWRGGSAVTSSLPTHSAPASGTTKPATILSSVVLPEPLGPSRVRNSPGLTSRDSGPRTGVPPYDLATPLKVSARASVAIGALRRGRAPRRRFHCDEYDERDRNENGGCDGGDG